MQFVAHRTEGWSAMPASLLASLVRFSKVIRSRAEADHQLFTGNGRDCRAGGRPGFDDGCGRWIGGGDQDGQAADYHAGGGDSGGEVRLASGPGRAQRERGSDAYGVGELLFSAIDGCEGRRGSAEEPGKECDREGGRGAMAQGVV